MVVFHSLQGSGFLSASNLTQVHMVLVTAPQKTTNVLFTIHWQNRDCNGCRPGPYGNYFNRRNGNENINQLL